MRVNLSPADIEALKSILRRAEDDFDHYTGYMAGDMTPEEIKTYTESFQNDSERVRRLITRARRSK